MIRQTRRRDDVRGPADLVRLLVIVARLRRRHSHAGTRVRGAVHEFIEAVREYLGGTGRTTFRIVRLDGQLKHDRNPLAPKDECVLELVRLMSRRDCGGIIFRAELTAASVAGLLDWMAGDRDRPGRDSFTGIEVVGTSPTDVAAAVSAPFGLSDLDHAFQIAAASRAGLQQIFDELSRGYALDLVQVRHLVHWILERLPEGDRSVAAPVFLSPPDSTPAGHATHVFLLTLALVHPYAKDRDELESLCTAALLHDVGLAHARHGTGPARSVRDAHEAKLHPTRGADILAACTGIEPSAIEVAYLHHLLDDDSGYPALLHELEPSPVADAVNVAGFIERNTGKSATRKASSFADAIAALSTDPCLANKQDVVQAFLIDLTPTPPGTLVRVRSGAVGVVIGVDPEAPDAPTIALVQDGEGHDLDAPERIDLREEHADDRKIESVLLRPPHPLQQQR